MRVIAIISKRRSPPSAIPKPPLVVVDGDMHLPDVDIPTFDTAALDPALWIFSGGTTGLPKAVVQTHQSFANTTELYGKGILGLTAEDVTIAVPKLYFGYAMGSNLFFPFSVGASAVLFADQSTPDALFDRIERHRATVLVNVPSAINQMLSHPETANRDMASLRVATSAGEALPDTLYHQWTERFGVELLDGLGTAEMWHIFVSNRVGEVRPGTLGRVVPGFEIKVCDEEGDELPTGEVGRLWVKGDSLGLGYFENPEATADAFRGEWFAGGDLVSIDGDGYVTHRGRADDAIKVKGRWFRPQEVESVLLDHPAVRGVRRGRDQRRGGSGQARRLRRGVGHHRGRADRMGPLPSRGLQASPPRPLRRTSSADSSGQSRPGSVEGPRRRRVIPALGPGRD